MFFALRNKEDMVRDPFKWQPEDVSSVPAFSHRLVLVWQVSPDIALRRSVQCGF